jgi:hypothetical protein
LNLPEPELQVSFANALSEIRVQYLQDALKETMADISVPDVDRELAEYVPAHSLGLLAAHGLRGELMFPVPVLFQANPRLLAYYRLLYGYSRKEFYTSDTGFGRFVGMEDRGLIRGNLDQFVPEICRELCKAGSLLLSAISNTVVSASFLDDLTLLTLGPQLRGGANVRKGSAGIRTVFNAIRDIVSEAVSSLSDHQIEIQNAAGRKVLIEFAPDPDIIIREEMRPGQFRQLIAIEVKAGSDFSNIHNRIGEAEKSHRKAREAGYVECWTVVNVDRVDIDMAHRESPTTNRFYRISDMVTADGVDYSDFRDRVVSLTGIASK